MVAVSSTEPRAASTCRASRSRRHCAVQFLPRPLLCAVLVILSINASSAHQQPARRRLVAPDVAGGPDYGCPVGMCPYSNLDTHVVTCYPCPNDLFFEAAQNQEAARAEVEARMETKAETHVAKGRASCRCEKDGMCAMQRPDSSSTNTDKQGPMCFCVPCPKPRTLRRGDK